MSLSGTAVVVYSFYILYAGDVMIFYLDVSGMIVQYNVYVLSYPVMWSIEK